MRIGQAIDNVYQNKELEYESENLHIRYNPYLQEVIVKRKNSNYNTVVLLGCYDKERFELVQKPVTFMEIGKSKNIRIEHDILLDCDKLTFRDTREMLSYLVKTFINSGVVEILTEGKFYIKEDN